MLTKSIASDLGKLDPLLYQTQDKDTFKLNIALKYSILEDVISIIIFKCTLKVKYPVGFFKNNPVKYV